MQAGLSSAGGAPRSAPTPLDLSRSQVGLAALPATRPQHRRRPVHWHLASLPKPICVGCSRHRRHGSSVRAPRASAAAAHLLSLTLLPEPALAARNVAGAQAGHTPLVPEQVAVV
ncbi:unnamed protein product [Urochloa humidicola]